MNKSLSKQTKSILTGIALLFAQSANAATVCVNPNSMKCSPTVAEGITAAQPGDTVSIAPGTYFEEAILIEKSLTITGSANSIIDGGQIPDPADSVTPIALIHGSKHGFIVNASDVSIQGISIKNTGGNGIQIDSGFTGLTVNQVNFNNIGASCIYSDSGNNDLTVTGSKLTSCRFDGIIVQGNMANINKNILKHMTLGIGIFGNGATVAKNEVYVAEGDLMVNGNDALITQNKLFHSLHEGIFVFGENPVVNLNTVEGTFSPSIYVRCSTNCDKARITKNKLSPQSYGISTDSSAGGLLVEKNSITMSRTDAILLRGNGKTTINNNQISLAGSRDSDNCIYAFDGAHVITNNKLNGCSASGIYARGDNIEVGFNTIIGAGTSGIVADADGVKVHNNIVSGSTGFGVIVGINHTGVEITNNTIKNNRNQICDASPASTVITNNTGTGAIWKVGATFGTVGVDDCNFL